MRWKYPTFDDWRDAGPYSRRQLVDAYRSRFECCFEDSREIEPDDPNIQLMEEEYLDQPATLEWVRGREGWHGDDEVQWLGSSEFNVREMAVLQLRSMARVLCNSPTRRQVIAAENFAKEMGWV